MEIVKVSIHAPVQAGDEDIGRECAGKESFNPRPRTSGRPQTKNSKGDNTMVSIHAPVQAGDLSLLTYTNPISGFNPRPRTSGRPVIINAC